MPGWSQDQAPAPAAALSSPSGSASKQSDSAKVKPLGSPDKPVVAPLGTPATAKMAPLGKASKPSVATLGKPGKPKFALKTSGGGGAGAAAPDRVVEVKRLIDTYHRIAIGYYDRMVLAETPDEIAAAEIHKPSAKALRPIVRLVAEIIAVDPTDEPALDALLFISKYVEVPIIDETLGKVVFQDGAKGVDINALILEHHADNPKVAKALRTWPKGPETDKFLAALFNKSHNPEVRASAGINLVNTLQRSEKADLAVQLAEIMAADRYLDGIPITPRPNGPTARDWAEGKVREIRLLSVGNVLPDVSGAKLGGDAESITDYRGKVVVLDVWTTWCGPCAAMIPHQREMVERYRDKPFALVSVSCDAERETLESFLETTEMPWDHWWVGTDSELQESLNIRSFPTILVLDPKGVIRFKNIKGEELDEAIESLLEEFTGSGDQTGG
ncbi:Thiol-disulfide oxidoreductase ResA [Botrimarina colliarenosi]|uniref:Thiol-disulfide oxidoreductase ResA n=1 Tax=Botrimarina colliarenosi TaxID=2528001 RepID=A0A5C5ZX34_9BACT|nr:Thiol-disulfide oxidoreductase ResA [Botrimarina colliarenosi]